MGGQRKAKIDKSATERKPKNYHNQSWENPQKLENILILQQSRCTNPWSLDTGVDNQHSRHAITSIYRENQKWTKAKQDENQKRSESKRTKPPKMRKYFNTPTIKAHDPMITWYRWRTEKSKSGQKHHRTKAKKGWESKRTKPPKMRKYFNTQTIKVYEIMITWYRCG